MSLREIVGWIASSTTGERAGWVIVHSLWQFAAVAILAAVALRALTSASALLRYRVLTGAILVMAALPVVPWLCLPAPASTRTALAAMGDAVAPMTPQASATASRLTMDSDPAAVALVMAPASTEPGAEVVTVRSLALALATHIRPWMGWIVVAWALGVVFFALRPLVGWLAWRRLTRVGVAPVPDFVEAIAARAAMMLGVARPVTVLASSIARVPAVAGWFRPVILVPAALLTTLPVAELEAILVHELVHVRRGDFLVNVLQMVIEALGFYHPAVWWLSRKIRETRELACDDLVLAAGESPLAYGRALVAVEELRSRSPAFALGASDGSLVARIRRITRLDPEPARASAWPLSALVASACVAATLLMMPGGPLAPSRAMAADAAADLPDLLTVKELTEEQAWAIVEAQAQKPSLGQWYDWKTLEHQLAALAAKGAAADDIAAVRAAIAREDAVCSPQHPLEPSLHPRGVPASIQRAANEFREFLFLPSLATMSPEVAAALADHQGPLHLPGLKELVPDAAGMFSGYADYTDSHLDISGLETLSVETAQILAQSGRRSIALPAVPLAPEAVEALNAFTGAISFPRMETLTPQAAALLIAKPGDKLVITLGRVTSLSEDMAAVLAEFDREHGRGIIDLGGLTEISPEVALALASCKSTLLLSGLQDLSPELAEVLASFTGHKLCLSGVKHLSPAAAEQLATHQDEIDLSGLQELSPELADALADYSGPLLRLSGVKRLSSAAANALARSSSALDLSGLESLETGVAGRFGGADTTLYLDGLTVLTPEVADELSFHAGMLSLRGITELSPEAARKIAAHTGGLQFPGLASLSAEVARLLAASNGYLTIGVKTLSREVAEQLAAHRDRLDLPALETMTVEVAEPFVGRENPLVLSGLHNLSPEARKLLEGVELGLPYAVSLEKRALCTAAEADEAVAARNPLQIQHIVALSPEAAEVLATGIEHLTLLGLETISPEVARALAKVRGKLVLGVKHLDHEEAAALATGSAYLQFDRLGELSPEAAQALATCSGWLELPALTTISADTAAALVRRSGTLELGGLTTLTPDVAAALATADERMQLRLDGLQSLSPEAAAALASCPASLMLTHLKRLSPEAAAAIGRRQGKLAIGIKRLSSAVARGLSQCTGHLYLDDIQSLSAEAAKALAPCHGCVMLRGLQRMSPDVAEAVVTCGNGLYLDGLETITPEVARALAKREQAVSLHGLTTLTPEVARVFAAGRAPLDLDGLASISPDVTAALVEAEPGRLHLGGLDGSVESLTPDLATLLVKSHQREDLGLEFAKLEALDGADAEAIARILATQKFRLALPALKRISARALEALRTKDGVELPEQKTLEVVP